MALSLSTAARNAAADAIGLLADAGAGAGRIRVYSGTKPASPGAAATGTLLAEFTLGDPAFGTAGLGTVTLDVSTPRTTTGLADGTAGWWRLLDSTEAAGTGLGILDGTVTASGGGGDLIASTVSVTSGGSVQISSLTVTIPAS